MSAPAILPSQIHEVTVHADGAQVRRRIVLSGVAGAPPLVQVIGLPLAAAGRPVRARVRDGGCEVLSCRLVAVPAPPEVGDDRVLEQAVETAGDACAEAQRRVDAALTRLRALNVLEPPPRPEGAKGQPPPSSPAAARFELLRFRDQQAERLGAELAAARAAAEAAGERQAQAQAALEQASSARAARAGELRLAAELQLRWPDAGEPGWIELEYTVPGARWAPSYVLRFDRDLGRVAIQLRGLVAQRSGEDWSGVRIACATAPLQGWCELPRLAGRRIGRAQPPPPSAWRPAPSGAEALFADWDAFAATQPRLVPTLRQQSNLGPSKPKPVPVAQAPCDDDVCDEVNAPPPCPSPQPMREEREEKRKKMDESPPGAAVRKSVRRMVSGDMAMSKSASVMPSVAKDVLGGASPAAEAAPEPEPEPGLTPGTDLLDFAALRLAADGPERGRPRPAMAFSEEPRWAQACAEARRRSGDLRPPPPGHQAVSPARYAVRWEGGLPVDVPADGGWHVVPLAEGASDVRLTLVVVPRESRTAFRSAAITSPFDRALTAGPADVYIGADFLLTARLPDIACGAAADLGLGVEQSLAVARNATFAEETAGMLGGSLHLRHSVQVSLHNKAAKPVAVEVRERLPQPDEQVEHCAVKELKVDPPWQEWRPAGSTLPGGRRWALTLAAGEKRDLVYEYRVEIPSKNELVGGNRREA
jgi:hypothetical protein